MVIKRGLIFSALTAALLVIGATIFTRNYFSVSVIKPVIGTPLVQELYIASKDFGEQVPIPEVNGIMYRYIPVGTPSETAKKYLTEQGFTVRDYAGRANGATIYASILMNHAGGNSTGWNYVLAIEMIESHDGGAKTIQKIMAKNLLLAL